MLPNRIGSTKRILNVSSEDMPEITSSEIKYALQQMKDGKSTGADQITSEILKMGGETLIEAMKVLLNRCLIEGKYLNPGEMHKLFFYTIKDNEIPSKAKITDIMNRIESLK